MRARLNTRIAVPLLTFGVMVASTLAPVALQLYRCDAMGQTMSAPCCPEEDGPATPHDTARFEAERCCTGFTVSLEKDAFDVTRPAPAPMASLLAIPVSTFAVLLDASAQRFAWTRAHFDSGPPILLKTRSLLI